MVFGEESPNVSSVTLTGQSIDSVNYSRDHLGTETRAKCGLVQWLHREIQCVIRTVGMYVCTADL